MDVVRKAEGGEGATGDNGFVAKIWPRKGRHPVGAATQPRPDPNGLAGPPLGGQWRAAPSGHPGSAPRPGPNSPAAPRPGRCPGVGRRRCRQDDDAGGVCSGLGATALTRRCASAPGWTASPWAAEQGAIHQGAPSAAASGGATLRQLDRVSREVAGPSGLGSRRRWTRRRGP